MTEIVKLLFSGLFPWLGGLIYLVVIFGSLSSLGRGIVQIKMNRKEKQDGKSSEANP